MQKKGVSVKVPKIGDEFVIPTDVATFEVAKVVEIVREKPIVELKNGVRLIRSKVENGTQFWEICRVPPEKKYLKNLLGYSDEQAAAAIAAIEEGVKTREYATFLIDAAKPLGTMETDRTGRDLYIAMENNKAPTLGVDTWAGVYYIEIGYPNDPFYLEALKAAVKHPGRIPR
jgi:hypothetical protein